jgi:hypothetical protein
MKILDIGAKRDGLICQSLGILAGFEEMAESWFGDDANLIERAFRDGILCARREHGIVLARQMHSDHDERGAECSGFDSVIEIEDPAARLLRRRAMEEIP